LKRAHAMPFGAEVRGDGVRFRLWAPAARRVELGLADAQGGHRWRVMPALDDGWYEVHAADAAAGTRYRYRLDGGDVLPDPAARFNPGDVHGDSEVVDPRAFDWTDGAWRNRPWHEAVIYELHVGTFTPRGTFAAVIERLDYLAALGVTALELMPLADFPGACNWGYDGVLPYAPDARYGAPDDLKALVVAAHARGLMVLVDVVYNHFGPEGNYLHRAAPPFFTERHHTPWGAAIDFEGPRSRTVRDFFIHNALYWIEEFHVDGLRLDAVHAIVDASQPDLPTELATRVREGPGRARDIHLVLENDRNEVHRLVRDDERRPRLYTAQWNDDCHHALHVLLTGESAAHYADYADDPLRRLGRCLAEGFAYQGEISAFRAAPRGEPSAALPPEAFVNFLQNHDQVGNRARGERLAALAPENALRIAVAIVLLAPAPPLLFMGEEFGAATPFQFFCDFGPELAQAVRNGRREEFAGLIDDATGLPDPTAPAAFERSTLDWSSVEHDGHARWHALYRDLLARRREAIVPLIPRIVPGQATHAIPAAGALDVRWPLDDGRALVLHARLPGSHAPIPTAPAGTSTVHALRDGHASNHAVVWRIEPAFR
jgi:maltooligosyltrehalose trehalohydrolase